MSAAGGCCSPATQAATFWRAWSRPKNRLSFNSSSRIRPLKDSHKPVLGRLARRDVVPVDAMILRPGQDGRGRELRAVVADDHGRTAPPSDQRCQLSRDAASRDRGVGDRRQALAGDVVDHVENAEAAARGELVVHEVQSTSGRSAWPRPGSAPACRPRSDDASGACAPSGLPRGRAAGSGSCGSMVRPHARSRTMQPAVAEPSPLDQPARAAAPAAPCRRTAGSIADRCSGPPR